MKRASVVIPHYNDAERLRRCLGALSEMPELEAVEVVVVDNVSPVDLGWMAEFPFARLVVEPQRGAASARNRGVQETSAERIAFLDSDCVPRLDWLARVLDMPLGATDIVGGEITTFDETPAPRSGAEAFETVFAFNQRRYIEDKGFTVTANLVTTRDLFLRVGDLRDDVSEDVEWCHRAAAQGARVTYDPALSVSHPTRQDWPGLRKKWLRTTTEAYGTGKSHKARWLAKAAAMPVSAVAHCARALNSPKLHGVGERMRAITTLFRLRFARSWWMLCLVLGKPPR